MADHTDTHARPVTLTVAQVQQVMHALESDADLSARRAAFEMIQDAYEDEDDAAPAYTIQVEREDDRTYFASWTTGDGKEGGSAAYATTVVGALAELCATLLKVDEDKHVEAREQARQPQPPTYPRVVDESPTYARVSVAEVEQGLGATADAVHASREPQNISDETINLIVQRVAAGARLSLPHRQMYLAVKDILRASASPSGDGKEI